MASKSKTQFSISWSSDRFQTAVAAALEIAQNVSSVQNNPRLPGEFTTLSTNCDSLSIKLEERPSSSCVNGTLDIRNTTDMESFKNSTCSPEQNCTENTQDSGINCSREKVETEQGLKTAFESLLIIDTMYQLHKDKETSLEDRNESFRKSLIHRTSEITSSKTLAQKLEKVKDFNSHLNKIIKEVQLLKQKLRNPIFHEAWNVHISYHRFVAQFFDYISSMIKDLENNIDSIQWNNNRDLEACTNMEPYMTTIGSRVAELQTNLDSLSEFRSWLEKMYTVDATLKMH